MADLNQENVSNNFFTRSGFGLEHDLIFVASKCSDFDHILILHNTHACMFDQEVNEEYKVGIKMLETFVMVRFNNDSMVLPIASQVLVQFHYVYF